MIATTAAALPVTSSRPKWWQWPTVLSLDAPLVAVTWQWLFGRAARVPLAWPHYIILAASVWLAYAGDRWLEAWRLPAERLRTQRHRLYQRRRYTVALVGIVVLAFDIAIALRCLTRAEFDGGVVLLAASSLYVLSHQGVHRHHRGRLPKEVCVAILITAGVALFPVVDETHSELLAAPALILFALLCFSNCTFISVWERDVDATQDQVSLVRQYPSATIFVRSLAVILVAASLLAAGVTAGAFRIAALCVASSTALLLWIDRSEPQLGRQAARVLADVALLTPLVPWAASLNI